MRGKDVNIHGLPCRDLNVSRNAFVMFGLDHPSLAYEHPYRRRTFWRIVLPNPFSNLIDKCENCEAVNGEHHWYNVDGERSGCYHCRIVREGRLWEE